MKTLLTALLLLLSLCLFFANGQDFQVILSSPTVQAQIGKKVEFSCRSLGNTVLQYPVNWYKVSFRDPNQLNTITKFVGTEPDYAGRIKATAKQIKDKETKFTLTINPVEEGDDGWYQCAIVDGSGRTYKADKLELVVLKPVTNLDLTIQNSIFRNNNPDNKILLKSFEQPLPLICRSRGSNPEPRVQVKIGDVDVSGELQVDTKKELIGRPFKTGRQWTKALYDTQFLSKKYLMKKIECSAYSKGLSMDPITVSATVILNEKPIFKCKDIKTSIGSQVKLECTIYHSFKPVSQVQWVDQHRQLVLPTHKKVAGYKVKVKQLGNNTVLTNLDIGRITRKDNIYLVEVRHMGWTVDHKVRVQAVSQPSSGVLYKSSIFLPFALIVLLVAQL